MDVVEYADRGTRQVSTAERALLASDESSVVVAVSPATVMLLLKFHDESELLGRRVITIIPVRLAAMLTSAGTTLHVVNGRSPLLGVS